MKKIALLLVLVMILGSCFALSSCGNGSNSTDNTVDKKIQSAIEMAMVSELSYINAGRSSENRLYLQQTTITSRTPYDDNSETYEVFGKQKFKDVYDTIYVANFKAEVTKTSDGFSATIKNFGTLTKE